MQKSNVIDLKNLPEVDLLTQLIKDGAGRLVAQAMEAEVEVFINAIGELLENGRPRVVRNGYLDQGKRILILYNFNELEYIFGFYRSKSHVAGCIC